MIIEEVTVGGMASDPAALRKTAGNEAPRGPVPITIRGLTKDYGAFRALDDVNIQITRGEFLTILGPSGSGKSTLLMILAGFTRPTEGSILVGDSEMVHTPPHRRDIGVVFQNYALFPHLSVAENIAFPLRIRRTDKEQVRARVEGALDLVRLGGFGPRRVEELSGGQRQRVALARAVVFEPRILLMDEPLSALDRKLREAMQLEIRELHDRLGITTIYVTHDQREALTISDRVAVIHDGRIVQVDTPNLLYERPKNPFVADFIGQSTLLPVRIADDGVRCGEALLRTANAPDSGAQNFLVVRPEKLQPALGARDPQTHNLFHGIVSDIVNQGDSLLVTVRVDGDHALIWRQSTREDQRSFVPAVGAPVTLALLVSESILVQDGRP